MPKGESPGGARRTKSLKSSVALSLHDYTINELSCIIQHLDLFITQTLLTKPQIPSSVRSMKTAERAFITILTLLLSMSSISKSFASGPCDPIRATRDEIFYLEKEIEEKQALYSDAKTDEDRAKLVTKFMVPTQIGAASVGALGTAYLFATKDGRWFTVSEGSRTAGKYITTAGYTVAAGLLIYNYFDTPKERNKKASDVVADYMDQLNKQQKDYKRLTAKYDAMIKEHGCY